MCCGLGEEHTRLKKKKKTYRDQKWVGRDKKSILRPEVDKVVEKST